ncbi:MAG: hypothetical protein ACOYD7_05015 [Raoultibacter sp.]|jgi:hypothetical protein
MQGEKSGEEASSVTQDNREEERESMTVFGQEDREAETSEEDQTQHKKRSSRVLKVVLSLLFTWVLGVIFLGLTCFQLMEDRENVDTRWEEYKKSDEQVVQEVEAKASAGGATEVLCGTYLENLKEVNMADSYYEAVWLVWFKWEGDAPIDFTDDGFIFYNGIINRMNVLEDVVTDDGVHYQKFRVDVKVSQTFHTPRFPLENHIIRSYIEPNYDITDVILRQSSDVDSVNKNINIVGYDISRMTSDIKYYAYQDNHDNPIIPEGSVKLTSEFMDEIEINRSGIGLYVKCFIALWGTTLWVLIMLFVATRHRVDVFSMIPATLFGAVGNIMIGASLLPEALTLGLLEYGNIWGIFIVLAGTITITVLNRERFHWHDDNFADRYGRFMFFSILILAIVGNIALPLASMQF